MNSIFSAYPHPPPPNPVLLFFVVVVVCFGIQRLQHQHREEYMCHLFILSPLCIIMFVC